MHQVYLLLGSNKGFRFKNLLLARYFLQQEVGNITQISSIYETEAWGKSSKTSYLNQAFEILTYQTPFQLLRTLQKIEKKLGRTNKHNFAPRTIDIDILFYDDIILNAKNLIIPHPRLHLRNFTLQPLCEMDKTLIHPVLNENIDTLTKNCTDDLNVGIFKSAK